MLSRQLLTISIIVLALGTSACRKAEDSGSDSGPTTAATEAVELKTLRLNISEKSLKQSKDFEYFAAGHFGEKTQYNGRIADEFGGAYAVHCRSGLPFSIEVKYQGTGIKREQAMQVMNRLLPADAGEVIEHDDEDLKKMDASQAAEFFYYKGGPRTELLYADKSNQNVVQINVWTKNG